LDDIIALYEEVLAEHRAAGPPDADAEGRAAADYLRWAQTDLSRERESFKNSAVIRLRDRVLAAPLLGPTARALSRRLSR
ncbi:MAG: hypothetical protein H0T60_04315, partial [Acidobacteria bacterium]|nr:hypothetical protein [Acidobacteriota bacterium]